MTILNEVEIEDAVQESIDAYDMEATATQLSVAEYQNLWDGHVTQQEEATELLNNLEEEN